MQRRVLGKRDPETLTTANNLAMVLRKQGELPEAAALLRDR